MRRGRHVVYNLHAHVVLVTKYRRGVFTDEMPIRGDQLMRQVCADFEVELREFNGEHDRVHLLVHHPTKVTLSKLANSLKEVSARILRKEYSVLGHFWSGAYFAGSVGGAPLTILTEYIEQQKQPV
ncbi:IS200/IS605 family transposase [Nonomuraea sp. NPDC050022]|uniref:IS200/IS605 family transposase n=1 Tax=Nonomuraea sp. NPDC050022 TaxID=3364358 RepID=UPI0037AAEEB8